MISDINNKILNNLKESVNVNGELLESKKVIKEESSNNSDLEKLANDIIDWYGNDMGTYFDEIKGNEEDLFNETLAILENKDKKQIQHFIDDIDDANITERLKVIINESALKEDSWVHFSFEDGSNPYIAKTEKEANRILRKYKDRAVKIKDGFYTIKKEINESEEAKVNKLDEFIDELEHNYNIQMKEGDDTLVAIGYIIERLEDILTDNTENDFDKNVIRKYLDELENKKETIKNVLIKNGEDTEEWYNVGIDIGDIINRVKALRKSGTNKKTERKTKVNENLNEEEYTFQEIITKMENATDYSELYDAALLIKDNKFRTDVEQAISQCEDDGDSVKTAYSIVTSDLLDMKVNDENKEALEEETLNEDKYSDSTWYEYDIDGNKFNFLCRSWERSNAWGHEVELKSGYSTISTARVRYYNRTWEMFTYQTCMLKAIDNWIDSLSTGAIDQYKSMNDVSKLKSGQRQEILDADKNYILAKKLYDAVSKGRGLQESEEKEFKDTEVIKHTDKHSVLNHKKINETAGESERGYITGEVEAIIDGMTDIDIKKVNVDAVVDIVADEKIDINSPEFDERVTSIVRNMMDNQNLNEEQEDKVEGLNVYQDKYVAKAFKQAVLDGVFSEDQVDKVLTMLATDDRLSEEENK